MSHSIFSFNMNLRAMQINQGDRKHLNVNYTGAQSFVTALSYSVAQKLWVL